MSAEDTELAIDLQAVVQHLYERSRRKEDQFQFDPVDSDIATSFIVMMDALRVALEEGPRSPELSAEMNLLLAAMPASIKAKGSRVTWVRGMAFALEDWRGRYPLKPLVIKKVRKYFETLHQQLSGLGIS